MKDSEIQNICTFIQRVINPKTALFKIYSKKFLEARNHYYFLTVTAVWNVLPVAKEMRSVGSAPSCYWLWIVCKSVQSQLENLSDIIPNEPERAAKTEEWMKQTCRMLIVVCSLFRLSLGSLRAKKNGQNIQLVTGLTMKGLEN